MESTISPMKTEIIQEDRLIEAIECLKGGGLVAFPTETVYGLGAPVFSESSIQKIFSVKGRPSDNPLIVHVGSLEMCEAVAESLPPVFFHLVERYWPGPLTLVVPKRLEVPLCVSGGLATIAIRMPSHPIALRFIREVGPMAAPSANLSGKPSPTSAEDVLEDLEGKIPFIVDGGKCLVGIESTVLSLVGDRLRILRPGSIGKEELEAFLGAPIAGVAHDMPIQSPGMKYRHYSPKAKVVLVTQRRDLEGECILSPKPQGNMRLLTMQTLYREFRRADRMGISTIQIDCTDPALLGEAVLNRLIKAAQPHSSFYR